MRITQASVSRGVWSFGPQFLSKYSLTDMTSERSPLVMFGMYTSDDYKLYTSHKARIVVVWCGSDSMKINSKRLRILKSKPLTIHYAMSSFISDDLKKLGIKHTILPITPISVDIDPQPRGEHIYCYGLNNPKFYNIELAKEVAKRTGYPIILARHTTFTRPELMQAYKESFIGLRLTPHDGLPNTVIELGMMGRRNVYNGGIPYCIKWKGIDDICENVTKEYENRHQDNTHISTDIKNFINIPDSWLHLK
jgi:hypothetical protein